MEVLAQIFAFHFLTGSVKPVKKLSQLSTQMRLVCRLWDAVVISTPSLWVQLEFRRCLGFFGIPPDILSIWLQRSKTYSLHIELDCCGIVPQWFPVLISSIKRWESLMLDFSPESVDLVPQHIPLSLSRARRLKFLCISNPSLIIKHIPALIRTTPNLQSLFIQVRFAEHWAYIRSIASIVKNLSYLYLGRNKLDCECVWGNIV